MQQPKSIQYGQLQPHQLDALKWMASLYENGMNGILADDMGLGKTIMAISIICYIQENKKCKDPHLIIAPKSTISNWMKEFGRWAPHLTVVNLIPTMDVRNEIIQTQMQPGTFNVVVTTYDALNIVKAELRRISWHYVIFDEAHKLKNADSQVMQNSRKLPSVRRLLLTGTPLMNNVQELWALLNFLMPQLFSSAEDFDKWFNFDGNKQDFSNTAKMLVIQCLHRVMKPFILRRTKKDLATKLPDKIEINIAIQMQPLQIKLYQDLLCQLTDMGDKKISNKPMQNLLMQLRKTCNHPYLFNNVEEEGQDEFGEHLVTNSGKMLFLDKLLAKVQAQNEQILLFSQFVSMLDILEDYLMMRGYEYCRLDGATPLEERESQIEDFTRPGSSKLIFIISTRAGGLGINLVSANHVVIYDSDFNP